MSTHIGLILLSLGVTVCAVCPALGAEDMFLPDWHPRVMGADEAARRRRAAESVAGVELDQVRDDIRDLLSSTQDQWPSDYGHYGPLMIRLGWHNAGSYRTSDGRGGVDGARQRFDPERSWDDNTNLDKARALLWPIKEKYGQGLSWGDLIILAANTAIESMGGPVLGFCAGRIDDDDAYWSEGLGPSAEQAQDSPCPINGQCKVPLGSTTIGLIYLNPEGPMGKPDPVGSSADVRDSFGRMAMNDSETVALIGGGHAFGKTHGACPKGAGSSPKDDPLNPWPGNCGDGKGSHAFTSGFEGPWTTNPTQWDNTYFTNLKKHEWEVHIGPGGHHQWRVASGESPKAPGPQGGKQDIMMLTSDISLLNDPTGEYQKLVDLYASSPPTFDDAFAHAWYKLTTRDMGPVTRCLGTETPPAQAFQYPLPPPPSPLPDFSAVSADIGALLHTSNNVLPADIYNGVPNYGPLFVRLAFQCASSFRTTDYLGGCNGARIRFSPQKDWPVNVALDKTLLLLDGIKERYGDSLSWADLITLAGYVALEEAGGKAMPFCPGRSDAPDGAGAEYLSLSAGNFTQACPYTLKRWGELMGLTARETVVLLGGGHSLGAMHEGRSGFYGSWTDDPAHLSNDYFTTLLTGKWSEFVVPGTGKVQYKEENSDIYALATDIALLRDAPLLAIAQEYASNNTQFLEDFANAWVKMANADRFDGPAGNVCDKPTTSVFLSTSAAQREAASGPEDEYVWQVGGVYMCAAVVAVMAVAVAVVGGRRLLSSTAGVGRRGPVVLADSSLAKPTITQALFVRV